MTYQIYFVTDNYRQEMEVARLDATTEDAAAQEWLDGYKANNTGQDDQILEEITVGAAWIEAEKLQILYTDTDSIKYTKQED